MDDILLRKVPSKGRRVEIGVPDGEEIGGDWYGTIAVTLGEDPIGRGRMLPVAESEGKPLGRLSK